MKTDASVSFQILIQLLTSLRPMPCFYDEVIKLDLQSTNSILKFFNFENLFGEENWFGGGGQGNDELKRSPFDDFGLHQWSHAFTEGEEQDHEGGGRAQKKTGKEWDQNRKYAGDHFSGGDVKQWKKYGEDISHANKWGEDEHTWDWEEEGGSGMKEGGEWGGHTFEFKDFNKGEFKNYDYRELYGDNKNYHGVERQEAFGETDSRDKKHLDHTAKDYEKVHHGHYHQDKAKKNKHKNNEKSGQKKKSKGKRRKKGSKSSKGKLRNKGSKGKRRKNASGQQNINSHVGTKAHTKKAKRNDESNAKKKN